MMEFQLLRPEWLLMWLPLFAAWWLWRQRRARAGQWQQVVDAELLPHLVEAGPAVKRRFDGWLLAIGTLAIVALAGPAWDKQPTAVAEQEDAVVILLDQSLSMAATDLTPDRHTRAVQKITDILRSRKDGQTALVTYAGSAHTVTPLSNDMATLENLLPSLSPFIMPKPGSRPDIAIEKAQQLVQRAGINAGRLLLLTDGIQPKDIERIQAALNTRQFSLGIITVGTAEGAPVPMAEQGFLRDGNDQIVLPKLDTSPIQRLAQQNSAIEWRTLQLSDDDWQGLLQQGQQQQRLREQQQGEFDQWYDRGYWLIWLLLPVALFTFRRGALLCLPLLLWLPIDATQAEPQGADSNAEPSITETLTQAWQRAWKTENQRGEELMQQQDYSAAADAFERPDWRGYAAYQGGDYQRAVDAFAQGDSAADHYNRGNALAQSGQLPQAIDAYDQALAKRPRTGSRENQQATRARIA